MGKVHIVPKLMAMFLICKSYSFQFNDEASVNDKISNEIAYHNTSEMRRNRNLLLCRHPTRPDGNR